MNDMKRVLMGISFVLLFGSAFAAEPKSEVTIRFPLYDSVRQLVFRVGSDTWDPPEMHVVWRYTVLHSVTGYRRGLGFRISSEGRPLRIEAYEFDMKTGKRISSVKSVNHILTNLYPLLFADRTLASGDLYVFSFRYCDGYYYLVDVKKKETGSPTKPSTATE